MSSFIDKIKTLEWKKVLFFAVLAIVLQDLIIERLIPWIFMNNTIDYEYISFMKSMQFLIYISFSFYLCRNLDKNKFLHLLAFVISASLMSSVLVLVLYTIRALPMPNVLLFAVTNLLMLFVLLVPVIIGYFSERIYARIIPGETPFFMKLIFPISVVIGVVTLIPTLITPELGVLYSSIHGAPILLQIPVSLLFMGLSFFGAFELYESPLTFLWIVIIYYTLFFFVTGLFYLNFRKTRHIRWIALIILMVLFHLISAWIMFMTIMMSGG